MITHDLTLEEANLIPTEEIGPSKSIRLISQTLTKKPRSCAAFFMSTYQSFLRQLRLSAQTYGTTPWRCDRQ